MTEKGCQIARNEAERYCGVFSTLRQIESLSGLSRFVESNKLRKIFMCGDCPKYGAPCAHFEDVVSYIIEVRDLAIQEIKELDMDTADDEDAAEIGEGFHYVPKAEVDANSEEDDEPVEEGDLL